jgi:hypothetical protein
MTWFETIKAPVRNYKDTGKGVQLTPDGKIDYKKVNNNPRNVRYKYEEDPNLDNIHVGTGATQNDNKPERNEDLRDVQTGEKITDEQINTEDLLSSEGYKAGMDTFSSYKSANVDDYYKDLETILVKYSKTRGVQPHRNLMEAHIANFWAESYASLRTLYTRMDALAEIVSTKFSEKDDYLSPKDSGYVLSAMKNMRTNDEATLLGKRK